MVIIKDAISEHDAHVRSETGNLTLRLNFFRQVHMLGTLYGKPSNIDTMDLPGIPNVKSRSEVERIRIRLFRKTGSTFVLYWSNLPGLKIFINNFWYIFCKRLYRAGLRIRIRPDPGVLVRSGLESGFLNEVGSWSESNFQYMVGPGSGLNINFSCSIYWPK